HSGGQRDTAGDILRSWRGARGGVRGCGLVAVVRLGGVAVLRRGSAHGVHCDSSGTFWTVRAFAALAAAATPTPSPWGRGCAAPGHVRTAGAPPQPPAGPAPRG